MTLVEMLLDSDFKATIRNMTVPLRVVAGAIEVEPMTLSK